MQGGSQMKQEVRDEWALLGCRGLNLTSGILTMALCCSQIAVAANSGAVPAGSKPTPDPSPYERRLSLPPLYLLPPNQARSVSFEPRTFRLSLVCLVGTWNKQSDQVHDYFEKNHSFFVERRIGAVAAFSHDTPENLKTGPKSASHDIFLD